VTGIRSSGLRRDDFVEFKEKLKLKAKLNRKERDELPQRSLSKTPKFYFASFADFLCGLCGSMLGQASVFSEAIQGGLS